MATGKPPTPWRYGDGMPPPYASLWLVLMVVVSHLFLAPLALAAMIWWFWPSGTWQLVAIAALVAYFTTFFDRAQFDGRRRWPAFVAPWTRCHHYFPVKTLMFNGSKFTAMPEPAHDEVFPADKRFIFAVSPHGPVPVGAAVLGPQLTRWPSLSSRLRFGVASVCFYIPVVREFYLWFSSIDASRKTLHAALEAGCSVVILPGGIKEQLLVCSPFEERVVLRNRKGLAGLALDTGASIVPVYIFGERRAYKINSGMFSTVSAFLKSHCNIGLPFVRGRWWTLIPFAVPITIVIGKPIEVKQVSECCI